jgi:hypothetical protein
MCVHRKVFLLPTCPIAWQGIYYIFLELEQTQRPILIFYPSWVEKKEIIKKQGGAQGERKEIIPSF